MACNTKEIPRFKQGEQFEPVQPNRKRYDLPEALETHKPLRRSARLRERNLSQEISKTNKALRPPLEPAKTRASRKLEQLQPKRQKSQQRKGKTSHVDAGKPPQKNVAESTHSIKHPRNKFIRSWIRACAQLAEREELLESPSEIMPSSARVFALRHESQLTTAIAPSNRSRYRDKRFRTLLGKRNIYIASGGPPTELVTRATKIISEPHDSSETDDATALELSRIVDSLETEGEDVIIRELGIPLSLR